MARGKDLANLKQLEPEVLAEVVREGEVRLAAQFEAANSGDQRGLAWSGFVITVATALVGATAALVLAGTNRPLTVVSAVLAMAFAVSAFFAIDSVRPRRWAFPGNEPENWLPDQWASSDRSLESARVEQATVLNNLIDDNKTIADEVGKQLQISIDIAFFATIIGALGVLCVSLVGLVA